MGKKTIKPRVIPEQDGRIIGAICLCQLTLVLSGVALVYLSVAVYAPSHRAFHSGYDPNPVICETVNTTMENNCSWVSCGEWCLTRTSGFCPQMHVIVRNRGSLLRLNGCTRLQSVHCPPPNFENLAKTNCNSPRECTAMHGLFNCSLGHCSNYSELVECSNKGERPEIDVDKDSGKLTGQYWCHGTRCMKIKRPLDCERLCPRIGTIPTATNILMTVDNTVLAGYCTQGLAGADPDGADTNGPRSPAWTPGDGVLLISCGTVQRNEDVITATDCINGTTVPSSDIPQPFMNFSQLRWVWEEHLARQALLVNQRIQGSPLLLPPAISLQIFHYPSKLFINLGGCVNTLRGECKQFLQDYGQDGRGFTARSRYPCFYNKNDSQLVLARFDLEQTWRELMIAILVPTALFVVSLTTLCIINRSVKVGDDAKLRCLSCCKQKEAQPTPT